MTYDGPDNFADHEHLQPADLEQGLLNFRWFDGYAWNIVKMNDGTKILACFLVAKNAEPLTFGFSLEDAKSYHQALGEFIGMYELELSMDDIDGLMDVEPVDVEPVVRDRCDGPSWADEDGYCSHGNPWYYCHEPHESHGDIS